MTVINKILKMAEDNHGMVTSAMIDAANISRGCLNYLVNRGKLENTNRGIYVLPKIWEDEMYSLQSVNCKSKLNIFLIKKYYQ